MTKDDFLKLLLGAYRGPGSTEEGTFAGDVLRACADGMAQLWALDVDGLERRAFVATAVGEWLTMVCADRGVPGREGESDGELRARALERLARLPASENEDDYRVWCEGVEGILRVSVRPLARGRGTVDVIATGEDGAAPPRQLRPGPAAAAGLPRRGRRDRLRPERGGGEPAFAGAVRLGEGSAGVGGGGSMRLPEFVSELSPVLETLEALSAGEAVLRADAEEALSQVHVDTADRGLDLFEADFSLARREEDAARRALIKAALAGGRTLTPALLEELCRTIGGGDWSQVNEDFENWTVTVYEAAFGRLPPGACLECAGAFSRGIGVLAHKKGLLFGISCVIIKHMLYPGTLSS